MRKFLFMLALLISAVLVSCNNGQKTGPAVDDSIIEETVENTVVDTVTTDSVPCDSITE